MPSGLVEEEDGVDLRRAPLGDGLEMQVHRQGVGKGHDEAGADIPFGADRAEDAKVSVARIVPGAGSARARAREKASTSCPLMSPTIVGEHDW